MTDAAKNYLADVGYDPAFGARPLKRTIIKLLETPVSRFIISGQLHGGQTLVIDADEKGITFNFE